MTNEVALTHREAAIVLARVITRRALGGQGSGNFGHAGRPGEIGGSAPDGQTFGESAKVDQIVRDALDEMGDRQADPREHHIGIDAVTGERLFDVIGDAGGPEGAMAKGLINPGLDDLRPSAGVVPYGKIHDKQVIDIHTHPKYQGIEARGGIFSDGDLAYLTWSHIHTMVVVDEDSVGVLRKTEAFKRYQEKAWKGEGGKPWTPARVYERYNQVLDELTTPDKNWEPSQALRDTLKHVAGEMGVEFKTMPRRRLKTAGDEAGRKFGPQGWHSLGGAGSGNFGHAGRPGEVGGSSDGPAEDPDFDPYAETPEEASLPSLTKSDGKKLLLRQDRYFDPAVAKAVLGPVDAADVAQTMFDSLPGDATVTVRTDGDYPSVVLEAEGDNGTKITRQFIKGDYGLEVHHDFFRLGQFTQGQGIAKNVLRDSLKAYERLGVDYITTDANLDVGGYAWAKFGFVATEPLRYARQLERLIDERTFTAQEKDALHAVITKYQNDPQLPWHVADTVNGDKRIGKQLMLKTDWEAKLSLHDPVAVQRLKSYIHAR